MKALTNNESGSLSARSTSPAVVLHKQPRKTAVTQAVAALNNLSLQFSLKKAGIRKQTITS